MSQLVSPVPSEPPAPARMAGVAQRGGWLGQAAWVVYDGSKAPYSALVVLFVFSAYFTTVVIPDPVRGQAIWSYASSVAALLLAIGAPILGAIADAGGRRKPWIAACTILAVPCMAALWFATPTMGGGLNWIVIALIAAAVCFEYSAIFANALLPVVAPQSRIGLLSGLGLAVGNVSNFAVLLFFLLAWSWNSHPLFGLQLPRHEPERAVGPMAAAWLAVFALPLFLFSPDSPGAKQSAAQSVRQALRSLLGTLAKLREHGNVIRFLIARMVFGEGFIVMMMFTGVFAAGVLHWTPTMLIVQGLINSVFAALAGVIAGWLDLRIGSKVSTMIFVGGCLLANIVVCSVTPDTVFFVHLANVGHDGSLFPTMPDKLFMVTQASLALFITAGLASSRTLMARLSPPHMLNEFFGLFALSGTATSFIGPLAIGILTSAFRNQRAGVSVGVVFLAAGLVLLFPVRESRPSSG